MKVGFNGSIVESGEAVISIYDHGFLYGLGLFETFRTYGGRPYLLERHMERLRSGCAELGIRFTMSSSEIENWVRRLLAANGLLDGYIRLTVSAGEAPLGLPSGDYEHSNTLLLVKELPVVQDADLFRGRELRLLQTKRNTPEGSVRFKSLHYMNNILAKRELLGLSTAGKGSKALVAGEEARGITSQDLVAGEGVRGTANQALVAGEGVRGTASQALVAGEEVRGIASPDAIADDEVHGGVYVAPMPGAEGLMLTEAGWLTEGIVSNLFFVSKGIVCTPSIETGILPGVTRQRVLELAARAGYQTEEGLYTWQTLLDSDEIWMTNSIQELVPITTLTDTRFERFICSGGEAGKVMRELLLLYRSDTTN